ncbi:MAG: hypothetical protein IPK55_12050 [Streptococcus sp.]|nr:hypothetical protein [Streptococcus sp.]
MLELSSKTLGMVNEIVKFVIAACPASPQDTEQLERVPATKVGTKLSF